MTVGELITKLKGFDSDKTVYILEPSENPIGGGAGINNIFEIGGSNETMDNAIYIMED